MLEYQIHVRFHNDLGVISFRVGQDDPFNKIIVLDGQAGEQRFNPPDDPNESAPRQMQVDELFELLFLKVASFHQDLAAEHDGRGLGHAEFGVGHRLIFVARLGNKLYLQLQFFAQPGRHLLEMVSGLTLGLVQENAQL